MRKKLLILSCLCLICSCVSEQERSQASYMYEQTLLNQCSHTLGFSKATQSYMNCRMFYDSYVKTLGYDMKYPTYSKANKIQNIIDSTNHQCMLFWGGDEVETMDKSALWSCIKKTGQEQMDEAKHKKELEEQKELMTNSIAEGQRQANDDAVLKARIEAERERVAREKGTSPSKISCRTYHKSNGYVQIKCK